MKRVFALFLGLCLAAPVGAQTYPAKPVRLVVGFAAGGPTDVIARIVAQDMSATLGQGVIVENKTGANAMIATQDVKRAAPDGYTIPTRRRWPRAASPASRSTRRVSASSPLPERRCRS
jgi:tripartite-type tricarboxylate transporter receptor subunit TctC